MSKVSDRYNEIIGKSNISKYYDQELKNQQEQTLRGMFPAKNRFIQMGLDKTQNKLHTPKSLTEGVFFGGSFNDHISKLEEERDQRTFLENAGTDLVVKPLKIASAPIRYGSKALWDDSMKRGKEREGESFLQAAKTDLLVNPLKIATFLPRVLAGGISEVGKTVLEFTLTFGGAAVTDMSIAESSNFAVEAVTPSEAEAAAEKAFYGFETYSFAEYEGRIDKVLAENPLATDLEKAVYPKVLPIIMFATELMPEGAGARRGLQNLVTKLIKDSTEKAAYKTLIGAGFEKGFASTVSKYIPALKTRSQINTTLGLSAEKEAKKLAGEFMDSVSFNNTASKVSDVSVRSLDEASVFTAEAKDVLKAGYKDGDVSLNDYLHNLMKNNPTVAKLAKETNESSDLADDALFQKRFDNLPDRAKDIFLEISELLTKQADTYRLKVSEERMRIGKRLYDAGQTRTLVPTDVSGFSDALAKDKEMQRIAEEYPRAAQAAKQAEDSPHTQELFDNLEPKEQDAFIDLISRAAPKEAVEAPPLRNYFKDPKGNVPVTPSVKTARFHELAEAFPDAAKVFDMADGSIKKADFLSQPLNDADKAALEEMQDITMANLVKDPAFTGEDLVKPVLADEGNFGPAAVAIEKLYGPGTINTKNVGRVMGAEEKAIGEITDSVTNWMNGNVSDSPAWVPPHLGMLNIFQRFERILESGNVPNLVGSPEWELYDVLTERVIKESGIKGTRVHNRAPDFFLQRNHEMMWDPYSGESFFPIQRDRPGTSSRPVVADDVFDFSFEDTPVFSEKTTYDEYVEMTAAKIEKEEVAEIDTFLSGLKIPISTLKDHGAIIKNLKDWFDVSRNVFVEHYDTLRPFFKIHHKNRAKRVDDAARFESELVSSVVDDLGIKPGSKLSWAVLDYGEGRLTKKAMQKARTLLGKRRFTDDEIERVIKAEAWFSKQFREKFHEWNAWNEKYYPGDDSKKLGWKSNYFHHGETKGGQLAAGLRNISESVGLLNKVDDGVAALPLGKDGQTVASYNPFKKKRTGVGNDYDAVTSYHRYSQYFAYSKNLDPEIYRMNKFIKYLKDKTSKSNNLPNYIKQLEETVDDLAGHQAPLDNAIANEGTALGGSLKWMKYMQERLKINAILLNASSKVSQIMNAPFLAARAGPINTILASKEYSQELLHSLIPKTMKKWQPDYVPLTANSTFIKERKEGHKIYDQFNVGAVDNIKQVAGFALGVFDNGTNTYFYYALRNAAKKRGHSDPDFWADEMLRHIVGDRGAGGTALIHKSKAFDAIAPFLVEVLKQTHLQIETVFKKKRKNMSPDELKMHNNRVYDTFVLYVNIWAAESILSSVRGDGGYMDPIGALQEAYEIATTDNKTNSEKGTQVAGRLSGEVIGAVPVIGSAAVSIFTDRTGLEEEADIAFGESDPVRYGNTPLIWNAIGVSEEDGGFMNPFYSFASPFGGGAQLEKTLGGIQANIDGETTSNKPNVPPMPVDTSKIGMTKNFFFGQWVPNFKWNADLEDRMRKQFYDNRKLAFEDNEAQVRTNIEGLTDVEKDAYEKVMVEEKAEILAGEIKKIGYLAEHLDVFVLNQKKAKVAGQETDSSEEKAEFKKQEIAYYQAALDTVEGLSQRDKDLLAAYREKEHDAGSEKRADDRQNPETWLKHHIDSTYALVTHPIQTIDIWRAGEKVEKVVGGADGVVVPRRITGDEVKAWKKKVAAEEGVDYRDFDAGHIIPNSLGGTYVESNLILESPAENQAWTDVENYLSDAVKVDKLSRNKAIELIKRYKGVDGADIITFKEIQEIVGVEKFKDEDTFEYLEEFEQNRGINDWGRNMWPFSDAANTSRNDGHRRTLWDEITGVPTEKGIK